jgi:hypothetical protein
LRGSAKQALLPALSPLPSRPILGHILA